jgi:hypothetical protein
MPNSPYRLQILDRFVTVLKAVTGGDNYFYTPAEVTHNFAHWAEVKSYPAYLVYTGESEEAEIAGTSLYNETFFITVEGWISDATDPVRRLELCLRDVRKAINEDSKSSATGSLGQMTDETMVSDLQAISFKTDSPLASFQQRFRVRVTGDFGEL